MPARTNAEASLRLALLFHACALMKLDQLCQQDSTLTRPSSSTISTIVITTIIITYVVNANHAPCAPYDCVHAPTNPPDRRVCVCACMSPCLSVWLAFALIDAPFVTVPLSARSLVYEHATGWRLEHKRPIRRQDLGPARIAANLPQPVQPGRPLLVGSGRR